MHHEVSQQTLASCFKDGLSKLDIAFSAEQTQKQLALLNALYKWNKAYNLTAIKDPIEGLKLHLLDSLTLYPLCQQQKMGSSVLDVGTGPGFPGLPLAIAYPELAFTLVDSNSKKIRFIHQVIHQLGLTNVEPVHSRVESLEAQAFDLILSRAFASIKDMIGLTRGLLKSNGRWLAMKGDLTPEEIAEIPESVDTKRIINLVVPGVRAKRCVVEMTQG